MQYVIYCRRSSDEKSEKQTQSIPDQIKRCIEYAQNNGLEIAHKPTDFSEFETPEELLAEDNDSDLNNRKTYHETRHLFIIKESKTGKVPGVRKKRRKLISYIRQGKVQWLLSYSPDRQARNILEGWELINFVDEEKIDLKYTNFHFENTASGKMMLWIWFVFAKQYSDAISENVNRWNKETLARGKSLWSAKYGYTRREDGYYEPNEYFDIMRRAFELKIYEQKSDKVIAQRMNDHWWKKKRGKDENEASANWINAVWKDTFYYGLLCEGENVSDQNRDNPYFKPMISSEEFEILADRRASTSKTPLARKKIRDELEEITCIPRDMVKSEDWYSVTPNLPNKKSRHLKKLNELKKTNPNATLKDIVKPNQMRYAIKQKLSKYNWLEITGEDIENAVYAKLKTFQITDEVYKEYTEFMQGKADELYKKTTEQINALNVRINNERGNLRKYINNHMWIKKDPLEEEIYQNQKKAHEAKIDRLTKERDELWSKERSTYMEYEMFMSVMSKASQYYRKANYVQKATITSIFFSNITLDHKKRLHIAVKPIFEKLFLSNGADDATRTRNIFLGKEVH